MSFNFGNTSLGATSTPAKPTGFGSFSFGGGQPAPAPAFGTTATTSTAPAFGGTSAFGSTGFGAPAAQTNTSFAFGAPAVSSGPSLGGGGFGGFGAPTTAPSAFGGLSAATTTPGFGGFNPTPGFGGFGTSIPTTSAPLFGGGFGSTGAATTGFSGFGTSFGSTFGKPLTSTAPAFGGGFGTTFGQQQQQQQQQQQFQQQPQQLNPDEAFAQSIFNVTIFNDERDAIIAKWNYLQAMWGVGKSFYSQTAQPVEITPDNYLCRFKTIGFSRLPGKENKAGLVALIFKKDIVSLKNQQAQITSNLALIFGSKPNLVINFESYKSIPEKKTQAVIFIEEKNLQNPNESKRVLATDVSTYLNQPHIKPQLDAMQIEQVLALVVPDEDQLKEYLENPPKGIDPRMWRQAKIDNPDSSKFIPVPMIGFSKLKWRIECQENETEVHGQYLAKIEQDIAELKQRNAATTAKINESKRKLAELSHKILKVIVRQESTRKAGVALTPEEEVLRSKMENMQALVSAPTKFKGRLSELLSQMRMQRNQWTSSGSSEYTLDADSAEEMKGFLTMQQKAMQVLIDTVNKDMKALNIICDGMQQLTRKLHT